MNNHGITSFPIRIRMRDKINDNSAKFLFIHGGIIKLIFVNSNLIVRVEFVLTMLHIRQPLLKYVRRLMLRRQALAFTKPAV